MDQQRFLVQVGFLVADQDKVDPVEKPSSLNDAKWNEFLDRDTIAQ